MSLGPDDVKTIAHLARIAITEEQVPEYVTNLTNVLHLAEEMNAVDTAGVEPMAHPMDTLQRLREDQVTEQDQHQIFQAVAPAVSDDLYLVPKVIE